MIYQSLTLKTDLSYLHPWREKLVPRKMKENPCLIIVVSSRDQKSPNSIINNKNEVITSVSLLYSSEMKHLCKHMRLAGQIECRGQNEIRLG